MLLAPFPLELKLLGWHAVVEVALFGGFALLCYEWAFSSWEKLPFTCSHLPGKTPMWIRFLEDGWGVERLWDRRSFFVVCRARQATKNDGLSHWLSVSHPILRTLIE